MKLKSRYNLRLLDLDQIQFIVGNNQCIVIEEEEEMSAANPPTTNLPINPTVPTNHRSKPRKGDTVKFPKLILDLKKDQHNFFLRN
mgnify:CR=1 FL=1